MRESLGLEVVGNGLEGRDCGKVTTWYCPSCNRDFEAVHKCMDRMCPTCFRKWAFNRGADISEKLWAAQSSRAFLDQIGKEIYLLAPHERFTRPVRLYHFIISWKWDRERITTGIARELRRISYQICRDHRVLSGVAIFHAGRKPDRYSGRGPHVHIIGWARDILPGASPATPWFPLESHGHLIFKLAPWKRADGSVITWYIRSQKEARQLSYYLLTHCAVAPRMPAAVEFGNLRRFSRAELLEAARKGDIDVVERLGLDKCPRCGFLGVHPKDWYPKGVRIGVGKGIKPPPFS